MDKWVAGFRSGWLADYERTGKPDWDLYKGPRNRKTPTGRGVDLSRSRLMLISSAGAYLRNEQAPFDAADDMGDSSIRLFPSSVPLGALAFAHDHYDHEAVEADPQVLVPLRHLEDLVNEGAIGELAPSVLSMSGYQPDLRRLVNDLVPQILRTAEAEVIDAVLLVPA